MRKITERKVFLGALTPDGFVSFFSQIEDCYGLKKLYILKGGSGFGKSTLIKKFVAGLIKKHKDKNLTITHLICSADPNSTDGAIIHELGLAIIDGTSPHITDPKYPGLIGEIVDLAHCIDKTKIKTTPEELKPLMDKKAECYKNAIAELTKARNIHMVIESKMTGCLEFDKVDEVLEKLLNE